MARHVKTYKKCDPCVICIHHVHHVRRKEHPVHGMEHPVLRNYPIMYGPLGIPCPSNPCPHIKLLKKSSEKNGKCKKILVVFDVCFTSI